MPDMFPGRILQAGHREQFRNVVSRTEVENGPPKQARRRDRLLRRRSLRVLCETNAQYEQFVDWFHVEVSDGVAWFDYREPQETATRQARIVGGLIEGVVFEDPMKETAVVSFTVEMYD